MAVGTSITIMLVMTLGVRVFAVVFFSASASCSGEYPSCPVDPPPSEYLPPEEDEDDGASSSGPGAPSWPTWPSGDSLAEDEGYKRLGQGEICRCKLGDDPTCSREEPAAANADASCNVSEPEDLDCLGGGPLDGLCDFGNLADPDCDVQDPLHHAPPECPNTFWCCYTIECIGHPAEVLTNHEFCPAWLGYSNMTSRYLAYDLWHKRRVRPMRAYLRALYGTKACYIWEANCRESKGGPVCGRYPFE